MTKVLELRLKLNASINFSFKDKCFLSMLNISQHIFSGKRVDLGSNSSYLNSGYLLILQGRSVLLLLIQFSKIQIGHRYFLFKYLLLEFKKLT